MLTRSSYGVRMLLLPLWLSRVTVFTLAAGASLGLWVLLANRWLLHWKEGLLKSSVLMATLVGCALVGLGAATWRPVTAWIAPLLLVSGLLVGEVRRAWIRHCSRLESPPARVVPTEGGGALITTTTVELVHYRLPCPSGDLGPLRMVHLSDLHVSARLPRDYFDQVLERALSQAPDLLLLTGDFVSQTSALPLLEDLLGRELEAPLGTYFVLGNHDYWTDPDRVSALLQQAGAKPLAGRCERVPVGAGSLTLCGTERPWGPSATVSDAGVGPVIALSHTPDNIYELAELGADVVFSGHTHGGQLRLPWLGALVVPSRYGRRFDRGHFRVLRTHLFVSAGIGADSPPLRLNCPPQILVVDWVP